MEGLKEMGYKNPPPTVQKPKPTPAPPKKKIKSMNNEMVTITLERYEELMSDSIRYREAMKNIEEDKRSPSHEEIMTKWWKLDGSMWRKVKGYDPSISTGNVYNISKFYVNAGWFIGRQSSDLPPES